MNRVVRIGPRILACMGFGLLAVSSVGCQSTVGGQTLPSGFFLEDDVQYFPKGAEFKLINQARRLEEYKVQRHGFQEAMNQDQP